MQARAVSGATVAVCIVVACGDGPEPTAPCIPSETIVLADSTYTGLNLVDAGGCDTRHVALEGEFTAVATVPDTSMAYISIRRPGARYELVARHVPGLDVAWRLPLGDSAGPNVVDGVGLATGQVTAVSPDGSRLYLFRATRNGTHGIAVLDLATRRPLAHGGPWNVVVDGLVPLVPATTWPRGALLVVGERTEPGTYRDIGIHLLDPDSLTVMDSIPGDSLAGAQRIYQAVPTPDGRTLYVRDFQRIVRYDLIERRVTAAVLTDANGPVTIMPGGQTLVVTDFGDPDFPGTGRLWLYGPDLEPRGSIDVSSPLGGRPDGPSATVTGVAKPGSDGRTLYVASGTSDLGPLYPPQPARMLVVDVVDRRLVDVMEWGGYAHGYILFVLP